MTRKLIILILILVILGMGLWNYLVKTKVETEEVVEVVDVENVLPSEAVVEDNSDKIPEGWDQFESDELGIVIAYPQEMELTSDENGVRLIYIGETQSLGTEVYDGIILSIMAGEYQEDSFDEHVQEVYQQKQNEPAISEVSVLEPVRLANRNGYQFVEVGLGEFNNIYLPGREGEFLLITYLVADPEQMGYLEKLNSILDRLEIK